MSITYHSPVLSRMLEVGWGDGGLSTNSWDPLVKFAN